MGESSFRELLFFAWVSHSYPATPRMSLTLGFLKTGACLPKVTGRIEIRNLCRFWHTLAGANPLPFYFEANTTRYVLTTPLIVEFHNGSSDFCFGLFNIHFHAPSLADADTCGISVAAGGNGISTPHKCHSR